jgi:hypothetical protein
MRTFFLALIAFFYLSPALAGPTITTGTATACDFGDYNEITSGLGDNPGIAKYNPNIFCTAIWSADESPVAKGVNVIRFEYWIWDLTLDKLLIQHEIRFAQGSASASDPDGVPLPEGKFSDIGLTAPIGCSRPAHKYRILAVTTTEFYNSTKGSFTEITSGRSSDELIPPRGINDCK